jgi:hypothetical protein
MAVTYACSECRFYQVVDPITLKEKRRSGQQILCIHCGCELSPVQPRQGATDSQKRSRKQEKRAALREGGRRQPGSGAAEGFKGDVRAAGKYRGECKLTRAASYRLKLEDLTKLEQQATKSELPVFEIEFQGVNPHKSYVVMPLWVYETLMSESGRRDDEG